MNVTAGIAKFFRPKQVPPAAVDSEYATSLGEVDVAPLPGQRRPAPASKSPDRFRLTTPPSPTRPAPRNPVVETLHRHTAEIIAAAADSLCISCLYFTRENLAALGEGIRIAERLEQLDPIFRTALMDGQTEANAGPQFRALVECRTELYAGVEATRLAAQLFGLLRDCKVPASGVMPLRNVTDAAARAIRAAGAAVMSGDADAARAARAALTEAERMGAEFLALVPSLAVYRSETLCRMIAAALHAVLVSAQMLTEVSTRLALGEAVKPTCLDDLPPL